MADTKITTLDLITAEHYLSFKNKLWSCLERIVVSQQGKFGTKYENSYSTTSTQEKQGRFCVYFPLEKQSQFLIFAGVQLNQNPPWAGVWS